MTRRVRVIVGVGVAVLVVAGAVLVGTAAARRTTPAAAGNELTMPKAVVLGVVEGLTEYLPVSSTGHLTVAERMLDVGQRDATADAVKSYTVIIQIGAIVAVIWLFWGRLMQLLNGLVGRSAQGRRTLIRLVVAFVPAAIVGKGLEDTIESRLLAPFPVAVAWIVGGVGILVFARQLRAMGVGGKALEALTNRDALLIGVAQVLALWPGTSRSLVTIIAGLLVGLSLPAAVEFSFLLGLATLSAATGYEVLRHGLVVTDAFGVSSPALGIVVAFLAAVAAVKWMVTYLSRHDLSVFAWYRLAIGVVTIGFLATGVL